MAAAVEVFVQLGGSGVVGFDVWVIECVVRARVCVGERVGGWVLGGGRAALPNRTKPPVPWTWHRTYAGLLVVAGSSSRRSKSMYKLKSVFLLMWSREGRKVKSLVLVLASSLARKYRHL